MKNESEKAHGPWHPRVIGGQWAGEKNLRFDRTGKEKEKNNGMTKLALCVVMITGHLLLLFLDIVTGQRP